MLSESVLDSASEASGTVQISQSLRTRQDSFIPVEGDVPNLLFPSQQNESATQELLIDSTTGTLVTHLHDQTQQSPSAANADIRLHVSPAFSLETPTQELDTRQSMLVTSTLQNHSESSSVPEDNTLLLTQYQSRRSSSSSSESGAESFERGGEYRGSFTLKALRGVRQPAQSFSDSEEEDAEQQDTHQEAPSTADHLHESPGFSPTQNTTAILELNTGRPMVVSPTPRNYDESSSDSESEGPYGVEQNIQYRGSFVLRVDRTNESFSRNTLPKGLRSRSKKAVRKGIKLLENRDRYEKESLVSKICDPKRCCPCLKAAQPQTSPRLRAASSIGFRMMPNFFFPALPKFLEDIWVAIELLVAIFELIFAAVTFTGGAFILALTIVNFILAITDSFLYFSQAGSCAACFRFCRKKLSGRGKGEEDENEDNDENRQKHCQILTQKQIKFLNIWFETSRTVLSELLLYPLALSDLTELIESRTYEGEDAESRINFGLFIIGFFYLALSVYFMRLFMAFSSLFNLYRLPKNTGSNYVAVVAKFCIHIVGQVLVNALVLIMIATKIRTEIVSCAPTNGTNGSGDLETERALDASPFLLHNEVVGGLLPLIGVLMFFVVNYPKLKEFSMGFYVDMMSTVLTEGFADLVFQGEGVKQAKAKADTLLKKSELRQTTEDFEAYRNLLTVKQEILYDATHPQVVIATIFYFILLIAFLVCHVFTVNCDDEVELVLLEDSGVSATFFIGVVIIIIANYQVIWRALGSLTFATTTLILILLLPAIVILLIPIFIVVATYYLVFVKKQGNPRPATV